MLLLNNFNDFLQDVVSIIQIFAYTISVIIIGLSIINSVVNYIQEYNYPTKAFYDTRLILGESITLALSFILSIEVLKLFYVKNYKQLIIIVTLVLLKLGISYFLDYEIRSTPKYIIDKKI